METLPLLALLLAFGAVVLAFTYATVHKRASADLAAHSGLDRMNFSVTYWIEHGYFHSMGIPARPGSPPSGFYYYLSSTGGHLVPPFLLEKTFKAITGKTSIRLLALHNQIVTLLAAALLGLLAFRLARRVGATPFHALALAACVEAVHFTFPDNLAMFWELSGRQPFLIFATLFLLFEEHATEGRTRATMIAQGVAAFLMTYMEYAAGAAFLASWFMLTVVLGRRQISVRNLVATTILPMLLAVGLFGMQRRLVKVRYPDATTYGATFAFRSGLDGSTKYYGDHLDIAYRRDVPRAGFPAPNRPYLFRWKWTFFGGTAALLTILFLGARGRLPQIVLTSLLALLGSYVFYAAVFSQGFVIHPYLFDVLLFTPLALALLVIVPAYIESMTMHRGVLVAAVVFASVWLCMAQLRVYAVRYPLPPSAENGSP